MMKPWRYLGDHQMETIAVHSPCAPVWKWRSHRRALTLKWQWMSVGLEASKDNVFSSTFPVQMGKQWSRINAPWNSWLCIKTHHVPKTHRPSRQPGEGGPLHGKPDSRNTDSIFWPLSKTKPLLWAKPPKYNCGSPESFIRWNSLTKAIRFDLCFPINGVYQNRIGPRLLLWTLWACWISRWAHLF